MAPPERFGCARPALVVRVLYIPAGIPWQHAHFLPWGHDEERCGTALEISLYATHRAAAECRLRDPIQQRDYKVAASNRRIYGLLHTCRRDRRPHSVGPELNKEVRLNHLAIAHTSYVLYTEVDAPYVGG
jgi:hypothetical protein